MQLRFVRFRHVVFGNFGREHPENGIRRGCVVVETRHQDLGDVLGLAVTVLFDPPLEMGSRQHAQRQDEGGEPRAGKRDGHAWETAEVDAHASPGHG
jgi:hypothetical protein